MGFDLTPILYLALIIEVTLGVLSLTGGYFFVRAIVRRVKARSEAARPEDMPPILERGLRYSH